jgi:hypothetical protein
MLQYYFYNLGVLAMSTKRFYDGDRLPGSAGAEGPLGRSPDASGLLAGIRKGGCVMTSLLCSAQALLAGRPRCRPVGPSLADRVT